MPKFVESFQLRRAEIIDEHRFGLISRLFMKALWVAKIKGAKRQLNLAFIGEKDGLLHFDLLEENSTCIVSEGLSFTSVALNADGIPMVNEDGSPIQPPKGDRVWHKTRPLSEIPSVWYGDAYPTMDEIKMANDTVSADVKTQRARVNMVEVHGSDGNTKLMSLVDNQYRAS